MDNYRGSPAYRCRSPPRIVFDIDRAVRSKAKSSTKLRRLVSPSNSDEEIPYSFSTQLCHPSLLVLEDNGSTSWRRPSSVIDRGEPGATGQGWCLEPSLGFPFGLGETQPLRVFLLVDLVVLKIRPGA